MTRIAGLKNLFFVRETIMDVTIIGLAQTGKTTLLTALAGTETSESGIATVRVRDPRVDELAKIFNPKKKVYGEIRVREAAWPGTADTGRRSDIERYINAIRGSRLFLHVLASARTPMMTESPDPMRDLKKLDGEMIFSDLFAVERIVERAKKAPMEPQLKDLLLRLKTVLEAEEPLWTHALSEVERGLIAGFNFMTMTPQLIVVNIAEGEDENAFDASVFGNRLFGRHVMAMCFPVAREVSLMPGEEQDDFAREMGLSEAAAARVSREAFRQLDLISFLTSGEDECRAWPIPRGTLAKGAAGVIHSDIERGFIRAETVSYADFITRKTMKACREDGVLRLEGKTYPVEDGDIINFRFNV